MQTKTEKRITIATVKSFIRKHRDAGLMIEVKSDFDGMQDGVRETRGGFTPVRAATWYDRESNQYVEASRDNSNSMGINGVWFVLGSRDWFSRFETETMTGFEVSNCCGKWRVAVAK